jgi:hypothetical protein
MLVAEGRDVHTVKTMMGHANVSTTIDAYGGDFDRAKNADPNAPRPNYGNVLETAPATPGCGGLPKAAREAKRRLAETSGNGLRRLCKPEVTGSIPVRSMRKPAGNRGFLTA